MSTGSYLPDPDTTVTRQLQTALVGLFTVEDITLLDNKERPMVRFGGRLASGDQDTLFDAMVERFHRLGYTPILTQEDGLYVVRAVPVVVDGRVGKAWVNVLLFVLTVLSVLFLGALRENVDVIAHPLEIWRGWPFAVTIMGILTAHEFSHYFVGRRYGSPTSLPYFVPLPLSILGTMGAVIVQRGPMRSRKALFDIGIAGPLGGLVVAVPLLVLGLIFSTTGTPQELMGLPAGEPTAVTQEGNSILYLAAKYAVFGRILPDRQTGEDVWLSPPSAGGSIAFAAWAGLLVTALNLFPIGQFDGGHVAYAMWGRKAWSLARAFVGVIFAWGLLLTFVGNQAGTTWLVWGGLGLLMGARHPQPLNDVTPLDPKRRRLGWILVLIFVLILAPVPLIETVVP